MLYGHLLVSQTGITPTDLQNMGLTDKEEPKRSLDSIPPLQGIEGLEHIRVYEITGCSLVGKWQHLRCFTDANRISRTERKWFFDNLFFTMTKLTDLILNAYIASLGLPMK